MKSKYFTKKVWSVTDLIKLISKYKHEFEHAHDIEKLNNLHVFQHLVFHIFHRKYDSGMILKSEITNDRLQITICKHKYPYVMITFDTYEYRKRRPFYVQQLFIDFNEQPINNQQMLSNFVLNDSMLLQFFEHEQSSKCSY